MLFTFPDLRLKFFNLNKNVTQFVIFQRSYLLPDLDANSYEFTHFVQCHILKIFLRKALKKDPFLKFKLNLILKHIKPNLILMKIRKRGKELLQYLIKEFI